MLKNILSRLAPALASVVTAASLLLSPVTAQATETIIYLHNDISGSPQAATDASGNLLWKESYTPYGERTVNSPASGTGKGSNRLYFHGKKVEDLNGGVHLSYFGARCYDPSLGRFLSIDPQPFDPNNVHSFNRYAYGNNNPYKFTDPDGRNPAAVALLLHIGGGAVTGAAAAGTISVLGQLYLNGTVQWKGLGGVFDAMGEGAQIGAIVGPAYAGYVGSVRGAVAQAGLLEARAARDALASELAPLRGRAPATVTGGVNTKTGDVAARACGGGKCAEDHVVDALGGVKGDVKFTEAVRPRTGSEVPVCQRCETSYGRDAFPKNTRFRSDQ